MDDEVNIFVLQHVVHVAERKFYDTGIVRAHSGYEITARVLFETEFDHGLRQHVNLRRDPLGKVTDVRDDSYRFAELLEVAGKFDRCVSRDRTNDHEVGTSDLDPWPFP